MGWLKKLTRFATDFFINPFYALFNVTMDAVGSLFKMPTPSVPAAIKNQGKAYNAELKQNLPRLGDVRTVGYGRWTDWYDLKCAYTEYEGNEQLYKAYLHSSIGSVDVPALRIGNAALSSFPGQRSEVLLPSEAMTLVHPNVQPSSDVEGIEMRGGIYGEVKLTGSFDFAPSTGPGADAFRIRLIGSQALSAVPNGSLVITGAGPNSGTYTVTSQGAAPSGFTVYSWVVVTSGMTEGTHNATLSFGVIDLNAATVKATGLALVMDDVLSTITGPDESLADFQNGDVVELRDTIGNSGVEFTVLGVSDGTELTVDPAPTAESVEGASVVLVRRRAGPFDACLPGDKVDRVGFDIVFDGLSNNGGDRAVTFEARWREIDDVGNPTDDWNVEYFTCSGKEFKPQRFSHYLTIDPPARVQVDLQRITPESTASTIRDSALWAGLRGYVVAKDGETPNVDPTSTCIAVIVRSSGRLSRAQERTINGDNQRLLPIWSGDTWSAPQATRNPAWAILDWLKSQSNGLITDDQLDLPAYLAFAAGCDEREDFFDAAFDREVLLWEGAQTIARVARAKNFLDTSTGKISIYRDEPTAPTLLFADGINCSLGPTSITTRTRDTVSGVRVKFTDPTTWTERADGPVAGSDEDPREVSLMGCTSWAKAWAEAYYEWADLLYRVISFAGESEMEGLLARIGGRVLVGSAVKGWGQVAEVESADGEMLTLSLPQDVALNWVESAQHYVHLQGPDGLPTARIDCTRVSLWVIELAEPAGVDLRTGSGWRTIALIGHDGTEDVPASGPRLAMVESMAAQGLRQSSLEFRLDDERVHADPGEPPVDPYATTGEALDLSITGFDAYRDGLIRYFAVWDEVEGAIAYELEQQTTDGSWDRVCFGSLTDVTWNIKPGIWTTTVRVRAYGDDGRIGPWSTDIAGPPERITEDGDVRITEDGDVRVLE